MKSAITFFLLLVFVTGFTQPECKTPVPATPLLMDVSLNNQFRQMNVPLVVKVYIHVVDFEGGSLPQYQPQENNLLDAFEFTRQALAPAGICLVLAGLDSIQDNRISWMNDSDTSDVAVLRSYIKLGYLNIFIHERFMNENLLGTAYAIPNNFISLHQNWTWAGNKHLMPHEIGHALGLYHTFEDYYGREWVARSGNCSNCTTAGDLLCDTDADFKNVNYNHVSNCEYTQVLTDSCGNNYSIPIKNIMAYHRQNSCLEFTPQQMERMRYFLQTDPKLIQMTNMMDNYVVNSNGIYSSGRSVGVAKNSYSFMAPSIIVNGSARWNVAAKEVTIGPGTTMSPGPEGFVVIRTYPCQ